MLSRRISFAGISLPVVLLIIVPPLPRILFAQSSSAKPEASGWELIEGADPRTGHENRWLLLSNVAGTPGGRFDVHASCEGDTACKFLIYNKTSGRTILRSTVPDSYKFLDGGQPGQLCAHLSLAVGGADPMSYYSPNCDSDGFATVLFTGPGLWDRSADSVIGYMESAFPGANPEILGRLGSLIQDYSQITGAGFNRMGLSLNLEDVRIGAPLIVRIPFKDGSASTIHLNLRDPTFSSYVMASIAEAHRGEVEELVRQGQAFDAQGSYTKADQTYAKALELDSNNQAAKEGRAKAKADYDDLRRRSKEEKERKAKEARQRDIATALTGGQQACTNGDYATAITSYSRVLQIDGANQAAQQALVVAQQKQAAIEQEEAKNRPLGWWVDPSRLLMWTIRDNGSDLSWKNAKKYCAELRLGGFSDWRLATPQELQQIYDAGVSGQTPKIRRDAYIRHSGRMEEFPEGSSWTYHVRGKIELTGLEVWSLQQRDSKWDPPVNAFDFSRNTMFPDNPIIGDGHRALCVRSNPHPEAPPPSCSPAPPQTAHQ